MRKLLAKKTQELQAKQQMSKSPPQASKAMTTASAEQIVDDDAAVDNADVGMDDGAEASGRTADDDAVRSTRAGTWPVVHATEPTRASPAKTDANDAATSKLRIHTLLGEVVDALDMSSSDHASELTAAREQLAEFELRIAELRASVRAAEQKTKAVPNAALLQKQLEEKTMLLEDKDSQISTLLQEGVFVAKSPCRLSDACEQEKNFPSKRQN